MKHRVAIILLLTGLVCILLLFDEPNIYVSLIVVLIVLFGVFLFVGVTTMKWNYFFYSINRVSPGKIVFTFDDGPVENTLKILEILKKHQVKAVFFVIGKNCVGQEDLLLKIIKDGHDIGNHSFSHEVKLGWSSTKVIIEEIEKTNAIIEEITGVKPKYYRPPFGVTNPNIGRAVRKTKMTSVGWTIRSFDTVIKNSDQLIQKVLPRLDKKGHILLMHDTCSQTAEGLGSLIEECKKKGIQIVGLS